ncbi:hypothetical protein ES703_71276 [subsurface metagenome]
MAKLDTISVTLKIPGITEIKGVWKPDKTEREAAWEIYVELITRISTAELKPGEGLLREALSSLYTLFNSTRNILRKYGPTVAQARGKDNISLGYLAVAILNTVLRPVLAKWHPLLLDYEGNKEPSISPLEHEQRWDKAKELRRELNGVRDILTDYAELLAQVARVPSLKTREKE